MSTSAEDGWRRTHSPARTGIVNVNVEPAPSWLFTPIRLPGSATSIEPAGDLLPRDASVGAVKRWRHFRHEARHLVLHLRVRF
jgi:hypothetical protein